MVVVCLAVVLRWYIVLSFGCTSPTEIYTCSHTLSLHAALPISVGPGAVVAQRGSRPVGKTQRPLAAYRLFVGGCAGRIRGMVAGPAWAARRARCRRHRLCPGCCGTRQ